MMPSSTPDMAKSRLPDAGWAWPLGYWTAVAATVLGVIYFACIVFAGLTGGMTLPPPMWLQTAGGLVSLFTCPLLVALLAAVHAVTPPEKRALSLTALGLVIVYAAFVSINRFTQFGVVRLAAADTPGLGWFLPYGERSVMLGLEIAGWGWFLGLALLAAAPLFDGWLRWLCVLYAVLGVIAVAGRFPARQPGFGRRLCGLGLCAVPHHRAAGEAVSEGDGEIGFAAGALLAGREGRLDSLAQVARGVTVGLQRLSEERQTDGVEEFILELIADLGFGELVTRIVQFDDQQRGEQARCAQQEIDVLAEELVAMELLVGRVIIQSDKVGQPHLGQNLITVLEGAQQGQVELLFLEREDRFVFAIARRLAGSEIKLQHWRRGRPGDGRRRQGFARRPILRRRAGVYAEEPAEPLPKAEEELSHSAFLSCDRDEAAVANRPLKDELIGDYTRQGAGGHVAEPESARGRGLKRRV